MCRPSCRVAKDGDDDLALARVLQEQERAYFLLVSGGDPGAAAPDEQDGAPEDAAAEEEDESLALARELQAEEEREHNARLLAMAGLAPGAAGAPGASHRGSLHR